MPFLDTSSLPVIERLPGWFGRYFHSGRMTFGLYNFVAGATIHQHYHPQEEVWQVLEGEVEMTVDGAAQVLAAGAVAIIPPEVRHSARALTDGRALVVDTPLRPEFG